MKYIVGSSFGKDSMATTLVALEKGVPIDEILYCEVMFDKEISGEVPEHRDFIYDKAIPFFEKHGIKTNVVRSDKTFVELFQKVVGSGNAAGKIWSWPLCGRCWVQRDLKVAPLNKYRKEHFANQEITYYVGLAHDEDERIARLNSNCVSLLDMYGIEEKQTYPICNSHGMLSPIYDFSCRNGCFFCPNAKKKELRHLYDNHKDLWGALLELQALPNKATEHFTRELRFCDIDEQFRLEDAQLTFFEDRSITPFDTKRINDFERK